jgi:hypothetical protein
MAPIRRSGAAWLVLAAVILGSACTQGEIGAVKPNGDFVSDDDDLHGGDAGVGGGPGSPDATPAPLVYSGKYELTSIVDLAGANVFGDTISGTLVQLSQFHEHPAATILNLLALYNVPYYTQVWTVLPGFIKDAISGWLDDLIVKQVFGNVPAIDKAAQIVDDIASVSRNVELVTDMTLKPPGLGNVMRGEHIMVGLGFKLWTWHANIAIPQDFGQIAQLEVKATMTPKDFPDGHGATLAISKQNFAIPYGRMIMDALAEAVFKPAGATDLGSYLNKIFDCHAIAHALGDMCILGACVSDLVSDDSMENVCKSGLSTLGFVVETAVRSLKFDLVDLTNGKCEMHDKGYADTKGDGKMDAITDGNWDLVVHLNGVSKTVPAPFDGKRIGDN